jgi:hypothetical protein
MDATRLVQAVYALGHFSRNFDNFYARFALNSRFLQDPKLRTVTGGWKNEGFFRAWQSNIGRKKC